MPDVVVCTTSVVAKEYVKMAIQLSIPINDEFNFVLETDYWATIVLGLLHMDKRPKSLLVGNERQLGPQVRSASMLKVDQEIYGNNFALQLQASLLERLVKRGHAFQV